MKYLFTLMIGLMFLQPAVKAGGDKYLEAMQSALALFDSSKSLEDLQNVANRFERIANAEPKEWLPLYYAAFCNANMVWMIKPGAETDASLWPRGLSGGHRECPQPG